MTKIGWNARPSNTQPFTARIPSIAWRFSLAAIAIAAGVARAQAPSQPAQMAAPDSKMSVPSGYSSHQSVDVGGRIASTTGSAAMYATLVNLQSGPRVLDESFEMHALPGTSHGLVDSLSAVGNGFGGDPNTFASLKFHKGKIYEFSGLFRRDRQYFDYDLLGNPNIPGGQSIPIGPAAAPTGSFPWPQVLQSPVLFNTVRRITDTSVTFFPLSTITYKFGYSQNIFQGPSLTPGVSSNFFAESIGAWDAILEEYQRNSTDDYFGAIEWKPAPSTRLTYEEQIAHYKADSFFTLSPGSLTLQEADGTKVAINDFDSWTPYTSFSCNANSMGGNPLLSASNTPGGLPIINAACDVASSYLRSQPTRIVYPTEIFRLQSTALPHVSMNGDVRYTNSNMNLYKYYENFQGLDGATRSITFNGYASAKREVIAADYGIIWQAGNNFSIADQVSYSNVHQPGTAFITTGATLNTPKTAGNETINYSGPLTAGTPTIIEGNPNGTPLSGFFGQRWFTNDLTGSWDVSRATLALTWRHANHVIAQGTPHNAPLVVGSSEDGTVTINEDGGILNAAFRPTSDWSLNGSVEVLYADNAFTPVGARQTKRYRLHTRYKLRPWATFSAAFNDLERHNNTNNNAAAVAAGDSAFEGPLNHVDQSRIGSVSAAIQPNERFGFDFNYAYTDVYTATNICYDNGASPTLPGTASTNAAGGPNVCAGVYARGSTTQLADWHARDFMSAPTQYASAALNVSPVKPIKANLGYRVSAVSGNQFFNDARAVNGSLNSTYQSPFSSIAWTIRHGLTWKAEYNYYGYGEGGPSGPQFCSTSTSLTSTVIPCTSLPEPTGLTEPSSGLTAPRNFHANNVMLAMHYEF